MKAANKRTVSKNSKNLSAMTLTELLVATMLVGVIMVGIVSVDYATRSTKQGALDYQLLAMDVQAAMLQITRDANLAVGDAQNVGVKIRQEGTDQVICFRHEDVGNPDIYSDDKWICYTHGPSFELYRGDNIPDPGTPPCQPVSDCSFYGGRMILDLSDPSVGSDPPNPDGNIYFEIGGDIATGQIEYIDFTLISLLDISIPYDPMTNPKYELTSRSSLPGLSR
ncbi:MAG: hypothetical protein KAJ18_03825 [Candidatus Omnitrophica bacterium]|nr:hypothetical protein [Candidatus Omnitrophota bacterium]